MALTVISINVNGLRGPSRRAGFLHWLHSLPCIPDIVCLQEAHCMSSEECSSCSPLLVYLLSLLIVISPFVMSFFLVRLLSFFFFLLLAAAFLHLVFLCWCCAFMACPALLTANQRLCWISRLTGDLFLVCHLLLRWIVFPVFLLL